MNGSSSSSGIAPTRFRELFRHHAGGVVVVTVDAGSGPVGFTATSFTSISLDPPLAAFAIGAHASAWPHVRTAPTAVVHLLAPQDGDLATQFATSGIDRFAPPTRWRRLPTGEPVLEHRGSWLHGRIVERRPIGDHHLVVLAVETVQLGSTDTALVYHGGAYHAVGGNA